MTCFICLVHGVSIQKFTCDEIRRNIDKMKATFREENSSEWVEKYMQVDKRYEEYAKELEEFLANCKCKVLEDKCSKCPDTDHENLFCRCEDRNIRLAKKLRIERRGMWQCEE